MDIMWEENKTSLPYCRWMCWDFSLRFKFVYTLSHSIWNILSPETVQAYFLKFLNDRSDTTILKYIHTATLTQHALQHQTENPAQGQQSSSSSLTLWWPQWGKMFQLIPIWSSWWSHHWVLLYDWGPYCRCLSVSKWERQEGGELWCALYISAYINSSSPERSSPQVWFYGCLHD